MLIFSVTFYTFAWQKPPLRLVDKREGWKITSVSSSLCCI